MEKAFNVQAEKGGAEMWCKLKGPKFAPLVYTTYGLSLNTIEEENYKRKWRKRGIAEIQGSTEHIMVANEIEKTIEEGINGKMNYLYKRRDKTIMQ